jgi:hypothetical protein
MSAFLHGMLLGWSAGLVVGGLLLACTGPWYVRVVGGVCVLVGSLIFLEELNDG